jgi:hypothetical protein
MKSLVMVVAGISLTALCWGAYGTLLHKGQHAMAESRLRPLICVGVAYFLIAIIIPVMILLTNGEKGQWSFSGSLWSVGAGAAGSLGALGIILALTSGGKPVYVMAIVFGGAPVINTLISITAAKLWKSEISPIFYAGLILVIVGAVTVLAFAPRPSKAPDASSRSPSSKSSLTDASAASSAKNTG